MGFAWALYKTFSHKKMNNDTVLSNLKKIPFLKFDGVEIDFETIQKEVLANNDWYEYTPPWILPTDELRAIHKNYKLVTLLGVNPLAKSSIVRQHFAWYKNQETKELEHYYDIPVSERKVYKTEIAHKFPALMRFVESITDNPISVQLVKTDGIHSLGWHSHQADPLISSFNKPEQCILHLPVITNPQCVHLVTSNNIENRYKFEPLDYYYSPNNGFHTQHFGAGELWFFNGYHKHSYKNYSLDARIDIIIYNDMTTNKKLFDLLKSQLTNYSGEYV